MGGTLSDQKTFPSNDLIEINVENQEWKEFENSKASPGPLFHHCACLHKLENHDDNEMIIFGGKSKKKHLQNKVWSFSFYRKEWKCLSEGDKMVSPRFGHSGVVFGNTLFVFGGMDEKKKLCRNELIAFNLKSKQWKLIEMSVSISGRCHHASVLDPESGDWYLFGGQSGKNVLNDFVRIKLSTYDEGAAKCESETLISDLSEEFSRIGHSMVLEKFESGLKFYSIGGYNMKKDFLDCVSLDLNNISKGWQIETEHTLSKTFENVSQDVGPVFHVTTPIIITKENETILTYFVFGGLYENTKPPKTKEKIKKEDIKKKSKLPEFDIIKFENELNDDIFRSVLSFLSIPDLLKLELVCKRLRICNLTTEDEFWKAYYHDRINWLKEASNTTKLEFNSQTGTYDTIIVPSTFYDTYLDSNSDYKRHFVELIGDLMKEADKNTNERLNLINRLPDIPKYTFRTREEVMQHELQPTVKSDIKVVLIGM